MVTSAAATPAVATSAVVAKRIFFMFFPRVKISNPKQALSGTSLSTPFVSLFLGSVRKLGSIRLFHSQAY